MTNARRIWLTPANAVLAVAVMALVVVASAVITQKVQGKKPAPALTSAEPSVEVSVPGVETTGPAYTVAGRVRLQPGQFVRDEASCQGPDAPVVVTDKTDTLIAYAPLQTGKTAGPDCVVPFTLTIPKGRGKYGVDVPTVGRLDYSEDQLADMVELAID